MRGVMRERQGWSWVGRVLLGAGLAAMIGGIGCAKVVAVPGGGVVLWEDACDDASCGTQGDDVRFVTRSGKDPLIASDPSKFVGAKMNPDALGEAPKPCGGGPIDPAQWGQRANVHHTVGIGEAQGAKIKERLSVDVARELKKVVAISAPEKNATLAPIIARVTDEAISTNQSVDVATYSLSPQTFKAQVAACGGQTANARVVRSLTVARIGIDASQRIRDALEKRITAEAELKDALLSPAEPSVRAVVNRIVALALANYTYVVAVGFEKV
jgi:hypothetical protein